MKFTPELLYSALEKYLFKTKLTERDKEYVLSQPRNFDPKTTLEYLIDNSEGRLDIYAPADELLTDLQYLVDFPNNSQYFGHLEDCMNLKNSQWGYQASNKNVLVPKSEVPLFLYRSLKVSIDDEVSMLLLKSYILKLYESGKNTFEYILEADMNKMYEEGLDELKKFNSEESSDEVHNIWYDFVKYTPEEAFSTISQFYDKECDQEYLTQTLELLIIDAKEKPILLNHHYYHFMLSTCQQLHIFMNYVQEHFPFMFQSNPKIDKSFPHFPTIRVFNTYGQKHVLVKDLELALINYENVKIDVETAEERKNGLILTMEYERFDSILKKAGITENDINLIPTYLQTTSHGVDVPIPTSYGTHCKQAGNAFREIFRIFSIDISWFNTVAEENYFKLVHWFESLLDVFCDTRKDELYFIETWKIDELKNQAYEQFKKYTRKSKYDPPNIVRFMTTEQMCEEVEKFGSNIEMNDKCWRAAWIWAKSDKNMSKWDVLVMYDNYCLYHFALNSIRIAKFLGYHFDRTTILNRLTFQKTPNSTMITPTSPMNNTTQAPKFYNELNARRIGFLNEYVYSMSTLSFECFHENDTCLKLALDKTIQDESVKSKIISLVYEAEIRKFETQRRSVFYLTEEEFHIFCQTTKKTMIEIMEDDSSSPTIDFDLNGCTTEAEKLRKIRKIWKNHFPIDEYSEKFQDLVQGILRNATDSNEEMITIGLKARRIFEECSKKIRSFKDYCRNNKERTIVMRIMCEARIDDFESWHMFSEEVLEAIEVVLENEGKLDTRKEQIEKWRQKWNAETFTTITIQLFKTILNVVGIEPSKFIFLPDVQFFRNYIKLPLKMGYNAMKILSPDGREVYHQSQAQFLIFQYGECDVLWDSENKKAKNKNKKKVWEEMKKIGKGYTLAESVEQIVRRVMYSDVAQKTPLSALHGKCFDDSLTNDELRRFNQFLPHLKLRSLVTYQCKALLMLIKVQDFLKLNLDEEMTKNFYKALTMSFGFVFVQNTETFEKLYQQGKEKGFLKAWIERLSLCLDKNPEASSDDDEDDDNMFRHMVKIISAANLKNESARPTYDAKELIEQHYLYDESDPLGTYAKEKKGTQLARKFESKRKVETPEEVNAKLMNLIPKAVMPISNEVFEPIDKLWKVFEDYIQKEFFEEEAISLCKALKGKQKNDSMKLKLSEYLDFTKNDGFELYKRKKVEDAEKKKAKREESSKVVVKYVTETKIVENCVNCRNIEKETVGFRRKIEKLERENKEYQKIVEQKEKELDISKSQINQNKLIYREEVQQHKEDVDSRDGKIEQLSTEIKQHREDSKVEKEELYAELRKTTKKADETVRKVKAELENAKVRENAKDKTIEEMADKIRQLETSLEISEEKLAISEIAREEAENDVNILRRQLEEF